jgi:hypothetical protein
MEILNTLETKIEKLLRIVKKAQESLIGLASTEEWGKALRDAGYYNRKDIKERVSSVFNIGFKCEGCSHKGSATCFTCRKVQSIINSF